MVTIGDNYWIKKNVLLKAERYSKCTCQYTIHRAFCPDVQEEHKRFHMKEIKCIVTASYKSLIYS
jgi:hypothetical protein